MLMKLTPEGLFLIADYEIIYRDEFDGLSMFDVTLMRRTTLVPNTTFSNLNVAAFAISADKKFVYLAHDSHKVSFHIEQVFNAFPS